MCLHKHRYLICELGQAQMTYRSRTGGPSKARAGTKSKSKRKLHHPPDPSARPAPQQDLSTSPLPPTTSANGQLLERILSIPPDAELLTLIRHALQPTIDAPDFVESVQRVKALLYERKWLEVFGDAELIKVYAGRWTPSRALCYRNLFASLPDIAGVFALAPTRKSELSLFGWEPKNSADKRYWETMNMIELLSYEDTQKGTIVS